MFRPLRRVKNQISVEAAKQLLLTQKRGVLAVNGDDGYPYALPVNYLYLPDEGKIYFHGAKAGHKFEAIQNNDKVCFTVFGNEQHKPGEWAPFVQSTVVFGRCRLMPDDIDKAAILRPLAARYYPGPQQIDAQLAKAASVAAAQLYEITIEHISGKQVQEK